MISQTEFNKLSDSERDNLIIEALKESIKLKLELLSLQKEIEKDLKENKME